MRYGKTVKAIICYFQEISLNFHFISSLSHQPIGFGVSNDKPPSFFSFPREKWRDYWTSLLIFSLQINKYNDRPTAKKIERQLATWKFATWKFATWKFAIWKFFYVTSSASGILITSRCNLQRKFCILLDTYALIPSLSSTS